ncbi:Glutamate-ammonia-ligase adenylyltransferase [uncultured Candidatus Thioglobus sp.]|nr:Glutamate-ammonia-ligase adenylyltransferase [uncultured Candidatus Thioglobus sp.]
MSQLDVTEPIADIESLRLLKYRELLRITALDVAQVIPYVDILLALSTLADYILRKALAIISNTSDMQWHGKRLPFALFSLGKLGAQELNYSSDVDLIFVCANAEDIDGDMYAYYALLVKMIQRFIRQMEEKHSCGYLYRVDLNLRPLGKSAPLVLPLDDTENYYTVSSDVWERFAWLRARCIVGAEPLGNEMSARLHAYKYRKFLEPSDIDRFISIKEAMQVQRNKSGAWNVKTGEGGIRDIEFFIQVLQIANAGFHPILQQTNTMTLLHNMVNLGLVDAIVAKSIQHSYLFLRRLENHLQMVDEAQVSDLPEELEARLMIAKSIGFTVGNVEQILKEFNQELQQSRDIALACFDKVLLKKSEH